MITKGKGSGKKRVISQREIDAHHDHHIASTLLTLVLNIAVRQGWQELTVMVRMSLEQVSKDYRQVIAEEGK